MSEPTDPNTIHAMSLIATLASLLEQHTNIPSWLLTTDDPTGHGIMVELPANTFHFIQVRSTDAAPTSAHIYRELAQRHDPVGAARAAALAGKDPPQRRT